MANENYIGVAMGLDVTDLKSGLSEANKQIQLANSEFKAASSTMEDWSKSTDGVKAKITQLSSVLDLQKKKLAGLEAEHKQVVATQGENSEAARKLKVQINNQKAVVNTTERELNNYKETLQEAEKGTIDLTNVSLKAGKAVANVGEGATESGKGLDTLKGVAAGVGGVIAGLATAVAGVVTGFFGLAESTREFREDMSKLNAAFEGANLSATSAEKTYDKLFSVIGESDTAVEAAQQIALLANSEEEAAKWAEQATNVTATFGDALKPETFFEAANETLKLNEATGAYVQMLEGTGMSVEEFNAGLQACTTEAEKQAYMLEVSEKAMGKAGEAYEAANKDIMASQEAQAELSRSMADLGAIAEPIMTTLKLLAVDLLESIKPFVELIGSGLKGAFEGSAGASELLADGISGILETLIGKISDMLPMAISLIADLAPKLIAIILEQIPVLLTQILSQLPLILQTLISMINMVAMELSKMLPTLIPIVIDTILLLVETLLDNIDMIIDAGISLIMGLADGLIEALPILIDKIPIILDKLISAISRNSPKLLESGIQLIVKLASGLIQAIPQLVSKIPEIITSIVKGFKESGSSMKDVGLNLVEGIWEGITGAASWLKDKITGFAGNVADWFKDTFQINSPSKLIENEVGIDVGKAVVPSRPSALRQVKKSINKFSGYVADNLGGIKDGLDSSGVYGANYSANGGTLMGNTTINAGMTVNYNGKLSRKELKKIENDNYTSIKMKLKNEGLVG